MNLEVQQSSKVLLVGWHIIELFVVASARRRLLCAAMPVFCYALELAVLLGFFWLFCYAFLTLRGYWPQITRH